MLLPLWEEEVIDWLPVKCHVFISVVLTRGAVFYSEVVEALLRNEALTNIADNKGCYPLHLAAWKGDEHIVKLLIHQGPSHPKLNEQVGPPLLITSPWSDLASKPMKSLFSVEEIEHLSALPDHL